MISLISRDPPQSLRFPNYNCKPPPHQGDDIGTGTCQRLSLTDQLNMGIRHVEIDINWTPEGILTCHSPVPLDPVTIAAVEEATKARNLTLDWDIEKLSCLKMSRPFKSSLQEVKVGRSLALCSEK
jgi:hypothetical protein